jgi:hypothetical protein
VLLPPDVNAMAVERRLVANSSLICADKRCFGEDTDRASRWLRITAIVVPHYGRRQADQGPFQSN